VTTPGRHARSSSAGHLSNHHQLPARACGCRWPPTARRRTARTAPACGTSESGWSAAASVMARTADDAGW